MITQQEARQKWIEALRSGTYKQTKLVLHNNEGYCCLGVACDLFAEELNLKRVWNDSVELFEGSRHSLSSELQSLLGLISSEGANKNAMKNCLSYLNDVDLYNFNQIADALESGEYWEDDDLEHEKIVLRHGWE